MTPAILLRLTVEPVLGWLEAEHRIPHDERAAILLLTIAAQECGLSDRCQVSDAGLRGPARGLWQFERAGGVAGVLRHPSTSAIAARVCASLIVPPDAFSVWQALEHCDALACAFARLLVRTDASPLPRTADEGWALYLRTWRPGAPHPATWAALWREAEAEVA